MKEDLKYFCNREIAGCQWSEDFRLPLLYSPTWLCDSQELISRCRVLLRGSVKIVMHLYLVRGLTVHVKRCICYPICFHGTVL